MLTVLVRYQISKRECLFTCERVEFAPLRNNDERSVQSAASLAERDRYNREDAGLLIIGKEEMRLPMTPLGDMDYRDVFVMNEHGKTVARYTL